MLRVVIYIKLWKQWDISSMRTYNKSFWASWSYHQCNSKVSLLPNIRRSTFKAKWPSSYWQLDLLWLWSHASSNWIAGFFLNISYKANFHLWFAHEQVKKFTNLMASYKNSICISNWNSSPCDSLLPSLHTNGRTKYQNYTI